MQNNELFSFSSQEEDLFFSFDDSRSLLRKICHIGGSLLNETLFIGAMISPLIQLSRSQWHPEIYCPYCEVEKKYLSLPWEKSTTSQGLTVFLTGLSGIPICWDRYIRTMRAENTQGHIFVPGIPKGGNCPLEDAGKPIYKALLNYRTRFPNQPICLVGVSNGARIAGYCDRQRGLDGATIKVISIAGVHWGSPLSKMIPETFLDLLRIDPELRKELYYQSEKAKTYLHEWRIASSRVRGKRERVFFATTEDEKLPCIHHSLPRITSLDVHHIIHRYTHISILHGIKDVVIEMIQDWMTRHQSR